MSRVYETQPVPQPPESEKFHRRLWELKRDRYQAMWSGAITRIQRDQSPTVITYLRSAAHRHDCYLAPGDRSVSDYAERIIEMIEAFPGENPVDKTLAIGMSMDKFASSMEWYWRDRETVFDNISTAREFTRLAGQYWDELHGIYTDHRALTPKERQDSLDRAVTFRKKAIDNLRCALESLRKEREL